MLNKRFLLLLFAISLLTLAPLHSAQENDDQGTWANDRVFYEIFVRSFYDSDGDGKGDIRGIIEKLDYLNDGDAATTDDLGINGIWLMPVMKSPSYHGYDAVDYYTIDEEYGTNNDFKLLMEEAHKRDIKVIVDLMLNHTSVQHPWFLESADPESDKAEWYVWQDEDPGYRGPDNQPVWHGYRGRYYYGVFWSGMPDLNFTNPEVTAQMYDVTRFWLEEMGVDGFRLDAIKHIIEDGRTQQNTPATRQWLADYQAFVKSIKPDALLVGEVWSPTIAIVPYVGSAVDIAFEFDLAEAIVRGATFGTPNIISTQLETVLESYPDDQYATFITNHDQNRFMSQTRGDWAAAKNGASLLLTLPGVPFIYYGEEIGMTGMKPDENIRTPMQWDSTPKTAGFTQGERTWYAVNRDAQEMTSVAAQTDAPDSLLTHYRALVQARVSSEALQHGEFVPVESSFRKVMAFLRHDEAQTVLVILNLDKKPVADYTLTLESGPLAADASAAALLASGEITAPTINAAGGFDAYTPLPELPANSVTLIELGG